MLYSSKPNPWANSPATRLMATSLGWQDCVSGPNPFIVAM